VKLIVVDRRRARVGLAMGIGSCVVVEGFQLVE
jgi:hypothetical protein